MTNYGDVEEEAAVTDRGSKSQPTGDTTGLLHTFLHTVRSQKNITIVEAFYSPRFSQRSLHLSVCFFSYPLKHSTFVCIEEHVIKVAAAIATQLFGLVQPRNINLKYKSAQELNSFPGNKTLILEGKDVASVLSQGRFVRQVDVMGEMTYWCIDLFAKCTNI